MDVEDLLTHLVQEQMHIPLIQVANPHFMMPTGNERQVDRRETILVFRPWTPVDRQNAIKDIPPLQEGVTPWGDAIWEMINVWGLNGHEVVQLFQDCLGLKWGRVRGNFTGNNRNNPPERLQAGSVALRDAVNEIIQRVGAVLAPRADYGKIGQTTQTDTETPAEYLDRLRPVFRQHAGIDYNEDDNNKH